MEEKRKRVNDIIDTLDMRKCLETSKCKGHGVRMGQLVIFTTLNLIVMGSNPGFFIDGVPPSANLAGLCIQLYVAMCMFSYVLTKSGYRWLH